MTPALRCGLYVPNFGPYGDARTLATIAAAAEAAGWDGCFIWDHVARPRRVDLVDPWIALAAMALATQRIRLGALVAPLARRRPWQVARLNPPLFDRRWDAAWPLEAVRAYVAQGPPVGGLRGGV